VVPYACVFTYDVIKAYFRKIGDMRFATPVNFILIGFSLIMALVFRDRAYTLATFSLMTVLITIHNWGLKRPWMPYFYVSMLLIFIPFLIVNGMLTGTGVQGEVVWYNESEIIGSRLGTVPFEDFFYGFDLVLLNVTLYETFQKSG
jgi:lycopene cyclase domain-containing protein